jgi:NADPH:quinone reductase-like Zn-dependent oxidoreductase
MTATMKASVYHEYGAPEVLRLEDVARPLPETEEVLIRVKATAVNSADWRLRKGDPWLARLYFGLSRPKKTILGTTLAGVVDQIGEGVTRFKPGDEVFGLTGADRLGAYAEYVCVPETAALALKPQNIPFAEAATVPFGAHTALHFLRKAGIEAGQDVLVYGASGAVGTAAVQLARHFGARVTGVCGTDNVELVRSLGADRVIDYRREDVDATAEHYDIIFETVDKARVSVLVRHLKDEGTLILGAALVKGMLQGTLFTLGSKKKLVAGIAQERTEDMVFFRELLEAGSLKPVVDRSYPLAELPAAHAYVEQGHKSGNVAVTIG